MLTIAVQHEIGDMVYVIGKDNEIIKAEITQISWSKCAKNTNGVLAFMCVYNKHLYAYINETTTIFGQFKKVFASYKKASDFAIKSITKCFEEEIEKLEIGIQNDKNINMDR